MVRRRLQSGSITPVWLFLIVTTLFMLMLFVDREWLNYQIRKVEQTADFAAEAGAATAQITHNLWIEGDLVTIIQRQECETCEPLTDWEYEPWWRSCSGSAEELGGSGWRSHCGCGPISESSSIICRRAQPLAPTIVWPSDVDATVKEVFTANWIDRPQSRVVLILPFQRVGERDSTLFVRLRLSSLFGLWQAAEYPAIGRSILQIPALNLAP